MSRTKLYSTMENNKFNPTYAGFNASHGVDNDDCIQFHFNELFENEKHSNGVYDLNLLTDLTKSNFSNVNSPSLKFDDTTYTLDDLLDLAVVPNNDQGNMFDFLSEDTELIFNELTGDVNLASPLSSTSEDSCDLQELLTNYESSLKEESTNKTNQTSNNENVFDNLLSNFSQDISQNNGENLSDLVLTTVSENMIGNLYNTLFQNQNTCISDSIQVQKNIDEPPSPSLSESGDDVRYAPYKKPKKSRTPEQKQRKKSQNRNAAERYRSKKKDELKSMNEEANELEEKNKELKSKVEGLRTEIDYLKNLMLDVIKARLAKGTLPADFLTSLKAVK